MKLFERGGRELIVKSYQVPHLINRIAYNSFRASKARRSYRYAEMLRQIGVGTPKPVGFILQVRGCCSVVVILSV